MTEPRIVILDGGTLNPGDLSWEPIAEQGELTVYLDTPAAEVVERTAGAEIVLTNKAPFDAAAFEALDDLRFVGVLATGYDVIDVEAARAYDVVVSNVPSYASDSVAQHVFALLLELTNRVAAHDDAVRRGEWKEATGFTFWNTRLTELAGKTLGVVGYGRIGARVAEIGAAFSMNVTAHSRSKTPETVAGDVRFVTLPELLRSSDVVSLNCALTADNVHMIGRAELDSMKPNALLINTARGALVDSPALAAALRDGGIAGCGLDVVDGEPVGGDHPLLDAPNLIVTPHNAWTSRESRRRLLNATAANVAAFLRGEPINTVTGNSS